MSSRNAGDARDAQMGYWIGDLPNSLAVLEVVEEDVEALALDTVVLDDNAGAADDLTGVALTVDLAKAGPGTEDLGVTDLSKGS